MITKQLHQEWLEYVAAYLSGQTKLQCLHQKSELRAQEILKYVADQSPFYRKHLHTKQGPLSMFRVLDGIPFTTKDDLRSAGTAVCSVPFSEIAMYYETTGTTGQPTPCPRASIDVETSGAYVQRAIAEIYQSTFGTMHALTAIMGPSELYAFGDTYGEICRNLGIPFVRLWPESPRVGLNKASHLITDLGVRSLICSPAVALALARLYISLGVDPRSTSVGQIFVLGELCTPEMLSNISRIWDAQCTHGLYGSQEVHAVAAGCSKGNLHLSETNYLAEILPIPGLDGEVGELCLTMLVPGAKPLIRFRTGDLVRLQSLEECGCGNPSRCLKIFGRINDVMTLGGSLILPASVESVILRAADWVLGYQVTVLAVDSGTDEIEVSMVAHIGGRSVAQVQKQLADHFGVPVRLQLVERLDLRTETGAYVSWKHARIRDQRKPTL
ncbi:coenzyme F390 synthetase [Xenorhabdus vietnamensis]|uniref:Coenzyme F390 synthetase n=1 Tax=Xenorhabdus vietnamensis TaxID=351656 RepID=A0A1Y2S6T2_9GAMM|nr:phenylacetate--CoA ligase family protein [Xenorhabdus vietnamensis]OTA14360.1 coenzyme F390 synthetase [Xenorhabdus vietnamensis]UVN17719.1 Phenylacetate-coenzyme A ligase [Xenorhabdus vietnamensis]